MSRAAAAHRSTPNRDELEDRPGVDLGKVEANPAELGIRFGFGFAVSVVAGIIGKLAGPHAGGLFLAFPAILPATLTLLQSHEGREKADEDAWGAIPGAVGMIAFAVLCAVGFTRLGIPPVLAAALVVWLAVSVGAWVVLQHAFGATSRNSKRRQ